MSVVEEYFDTEQCCAHGRVQLPFIWDLFQPTNPSSILFCPGDYRPALHVPVQGAVRRTFWELVGGLATGVQPGLGEGGGVLLPRRQDNQDCQAQPQVIERVIVGQQLFFNKLGHPANRLPRWAWGLFGCPLMCINRSKWFLMSLFAMVKKIPHAHIIATSVYFNCC